MLLLMVVVTSTDPPVRALSITCLIKEFVLQPVKALEIYLGEKNKLASVNYGGGDAGGGNVTVSYSYTTFNDFTVLHPEDPNASGAEWWANRSYLPDCISKNVDILDIMGGGVFALPLLSVVKR